jgi:uncharacterized protein (DUF4415 family)
MNISKLAHKKKSKNIDYSDIPELDDNFFKQAKIIIPKNKKLVSLRLDEEILEFFKAQGKRYQTRINAVLLAYIRSRH